MNTIYSTHLGCTVSMSESFNNVGYAEDASDVVRIGPGRVDNPFLVMAGALIHIDIDDHRDEVLGKIITVFDENPHFRGHIYRTFSGHRVLLTHQLAYPDTCPAVLKAFYPLIDELYHAGVIEQNFWSIRLTPKPGRDEKTVCRHLWSSAKGDPLAEQFAALHDVITGADRSA